MQQVTTTAVPGPAQQVKNNLRREINQMQGPLMKSRQTGQEKVANNKSMIKFEFEQIARNYEGDPPP